MRLLSAHAQHIGTRRSQQDSFGFADLADDTFRTHGGFLAVVCDGMGGMEHGDAASRAAVHTFLNSYAQKTPQESISAALERSARDANARVLGMARTLGLVEGMGTTLAAAVIHQDSLEYLSVGDSGVFLIRKGALRMLNRPHIFANLLDAAVARGALSREAALAHPERESLTSFIGAEHLEEIDCNSDRISLSEGDTLLLATDGLFKTLSEEEILDTLTGDPRNWAQALVARTIEQQRDYQDNVTVLTITLAGDVPLEYPATPVVEEPVAEESVGETPFSGGSTAEFAHPERQSNLVFWVAAIVLVALAAAAWGAWKFL